MTDIRARHEDKLLDKAVRYAQLVGGIRGWIDLTHPDPACPALPPISAARALAEIQRLLDEYNAEHAATGGDRP